MSMSNEQKFLRELTKLSKKYNLYVGGCGCFGSPYLYDKTGKVVVEEVTHLLNMEGHSTDLYVGSDPNTKKIVR